MTSLYTLSRQRSDISYAPSLSHFRSNFASSPMQRRSATPVVSFPRIRNSAGASGLIRTAHTLLNQQSLPSFSNISKVVIKVYHYGSIYYFQLKKEQVITKRISRTYGIFKYRTCNIRSRMCDTQHFIQL